MKFGQLIECNMRNIFLGKPYTKCGGETSPRPFPEKWKLSFIQIVIIVWEVEGYRNMLELKCSVLAFTAY